MQKWISLGRAALCASVMLAAALANCSCGGSLALEHSPSAVRAHSAIKVRPQALNYGNVPVGSSATLSLIVTNSGPSRVHILDARIQGAQFAIRRASLPSSVRGRGNTSLDIVFTPTSSGTASGGVAIMTRDQASPLTVRLSGKGVAPPSASRAAGNTTTANSGSLVPAISSGSGNLPAWAATPHQPSVPVVSLTWEPSPSPVLGYNVYRSEERGGPYTLLNTSSLVENVNFYRDTDVRSGHAYFYVVTDVDAAGDESVRSNQISVTAP